MPGFIRRRFHGPPGPTLTAKREGSRDLESLQRGEDVSPIEQDAVSDFHVRQIALPHPDLHAAGRLVETLGELSLGEQLIAVGDSRPGDTNFVFIDAYFRQSTNAPGVSATQSGEGFPRRFRSFQTLCCRLTC